MLARIYAYEGNTIFLQGLQGISKTKPKQTKYCSFSNRREKATVCYKYTLGAFILIFSCCFQNMLLKRLVYSSQQKKWWYRGEDINLFSFKGKMVLGSLIMW